MDLRSQLSVLRSHIRLLIVGVLIGGVTAFAVSAALPKTYDSSATLIVGQSLSSTNLSSDQLLASQRLSQTYTTIATTRPILQGVIDSLKLGVTVDDLRPRVSASAAQDSTLLTISVEDSNPERAADIANAIGNALIAASPTVQGQRTEAQQFVDQQLKATQQQIETTQTQITGLSGIQNRTPDQDTQLQQLNTQLAGLRNAYATLLASSTNSSANQVSIVDPAVASSGPAAPKLVTNTLLGILVGLLLAIAISFLIEYLDDTVKTAQDVEAVTHLPALGTIAQMKGATGRRRLSWLATLTNPRSPGAETFRILRTNLEFASLDEPLHTVLVTSSVPGEGKTTIASNLAAAFAQAGHRTLLVDADLRQPDIHQLFGLDNERGLTDLLRSDEIALSDVVHPTQERNLLVLTSGRLPPNPAELLGSQRMRNVMARLAASADLVIFDSTPVAMVTDAVVVSTLVDGTLIVVEAGRTTEDSLKRGREALAKVGARVLGVAVNRVPVAGFAYSYNDDAIVPAGPGAPPAPATPAAPAGAAGAGTPAVDAGR